MGYPALSRGTIRRPSFQFLSNHMKRKIKEKQKRLNNFILPYTKRKIYMHVFSHGVTDAHIFNYCQHKAVQQLHLLHADSSALLLNSTLVQNY